MTCFPSHVDLKTQKQYQQLDKRFFGIIISSFNESSTEIIAYQSNQNSECVNVGIVIDDQIHTGGYRSINVADITADEVVLSSKASYLNVLFEEERKRYTRYLGMAGNNTTHQMHIHLFSLMLMHLVPDVK